MLEGEKEKEREITVWEGWFTKSIFGFLLGPKTPNCIFLSIPLSKSGMNEIIDE